MIIIVLIEIFCCYIINRYLYSRPQIVLSEGEVEENIINRNIY